MSENILNSPSKAEIQPAHESNGLVDDTYFLMLENPPGGGKNKKGRSTVIRTMQHDMDRRNDPHAPNKMYLSESATVIFAS